MERHQVNERVRKVAVSEPEEDAGAETEQKEFNWG